MYNHSVSMHTGRYQH